ncbi:Glu-tRNA(Gln) amidotransferase subunit GatE [Candidatus Bathyarchaeota archaeon]|nr:Glu-tRNA(Gln) amidotransferase subunit GatE [Candidatus Bathyarchaeota archaeon]
MKEECDVTVPETQYRKIGLKVGLEIHQQLDTHAKLFCKCPPELFKDKPEITFQRRLRPTQSELGQIDPAAYFEFNKGIRIVYEANKETSCLVEMDEEPPHGLNMEALETTLTAAMMMKAKPVDEIHVMRKTVIDGSNTTGFQRTCVVAIGGEIKVGEKIVPIQHVSLEEDAARRSGGKGKMMRYRIDRLGIPLIEVATAPVIKSPGMAEEVALAIGKTLRATGKMKRGLGTIRQDLNISIRKGALVEIKGVQELELLSKVVEYEVQRQLKLAKIAEELKMTGIRKEDVADEFVDVTRIFEETKCKILQKSLGRGEQVLAVKLPRFKGFLRMELVSNVRLGTEMADQARFWGKVEGIFHTDELPAYEITKEEVNKMREVVGAENNDAVVLVAANLENATDALKAVTERARQAIVGVPDETRAGKADGTTWYMRPRPGAARMYPETDVPPSQITETYIEKIRSELPELPEEKFSRLTKDYGLNRKLARQVLDSEHSELLEIIVDETSVSPTTVAAFLTETLKALGREGVQIKNISDEKMRMIFRKIGKGELTKEALPDVSIWLSKHPDQSVQNAIESLGLKIISEDELKSFIDQVIKDNKDLIQKRGKHSFGVLMGAIMKELRGRVDATLARDLLKRKMDKIKR